MPRVADTFGASLDLFLSLTGRLTLSSAEYELAIRAGWELIPANVLDQLIIETMDAMPVDRRPKARIGWILPDIAEGYERWRKAIGH